MTRFMVRHVCGLDESRHVATRNGKWIFDEATQLVRIQYDDVYWISYPHFRILLNKMRKIHRVESTSECKLHYATLLHALAVLPVILMI